jgi:DNA gyrase subunit A
MEYVNIRQSGIQAIGLKDEDELIEVKITDRKKEIFLMTKHGQCIRFDENDVRSTGRVSMGVIGMNIGQDDEVVGMQLNTQGTDLLFVSEKGMGKRTDIDEFVIQRRGGKGVKCYKITAKTGNLVGVKAVNDNQEIMLITMEGIVIQIRIDDISKFGRITSGVKLMNVAEDITIARIAKVREKTPEEIEAEEAEVAREELEQSLLIEDEIIYEDDADYEEVIDETVDDIEK